jgi:hypothetical protein
MDKSTWISPRLPRDGIRLSKARRTENKHEEVCREHAKQLPGETREERCGKDASRRQPIQSRYTSAKLDTKKSVAKGLFLCKRARPDIQQAILVLCTRVRDPNQADWEKLMRVMKYLNGTRDENLTLSAERRRPTSGQMVCGRIICGTSRL